MFGRRGRVASKNLEKARADSRECVERILSSHRFIILKSNDPRERGLEDSVLNDAPLQRICDEAPYYEDVFEYAAMALEYIAVFHPFSEGNKRTAFATALRILHDNGYRLSDDEETYAFVREVAAGMYDRTQIAQWLEAHAVGSPSASRRRKGIGP